MYQETAIPRGVAYADSATRALFIRKTYVHLLAAILGFAAIEMYLFSSGIADRLAPA